MPDDFVIPRALWTRMIEVTNNFVKRYCLCGEHTSHTKIRMTVIDWLVMIVVTVPLALDITGVM